MKEKIKMNQHHNNVYSISTSVKTTTTQVQTLSGEVGNINRSLEGLLALMTPIAAHLGLQIPPQQTQPIQLQSPAHIATACSAAPHDIAVAADDAAVLV